MQSKDGKFVIKKCGYYIIDYNNNKIVDKDGNLITFKALEDARNFLKENNITGTVK